LRYVAIRVASVVPVLFFVSIIVFVTVSLLPGDAAIAFVGLGGGGQEQIAAIRETLGLGDPLPVRYWTWLTGVVQGDFGDSWITPGQSVTGLIGAALPNTIEILTVSVLLGTTVALAVGITAALKEGGLVDRGIMGATLLGISIPAYWTAILLLLVFAVKFPVLPVGDLPPIRKDPLGNLEAIVLPSVVLGLAIAAPLARFVRSGMLEALRADYVRTARAKGLTERRVVLRHALPNALLPVITFLGLIVGTLFGGAILIEVIFAIPGIGLLGVDAVFKRDVAVLQGVVLVIATAFVLTNLVTDLVQGYVDPRLRRARPSRGS
jgi:peptide/nickel transport system permease protein